MKKAVVAIGVPGAGKSTLMRAFAAKYGYEYLDYDEIKAEQPDLDAAQLWNYIRAHAAELFENGKTIVFDATFAGYTFRNKFTAFLKSIDVPKIVGIYVDTPAEIAIERATKRTERVVSADAVRYYDGLLQLHRPDVSDGFDSLFILDENLELSRVDIGPSEIEGEMGYSKEFKLR